MIYCFFSFPHSPPLIHQGALFFSVSMVTSITASSEIIRSAVVYVCVCVYLRRAIIFILLKELSDNAESVFSKPVASLRPWSLHHL